MKQKAGVRVFYHLAVFLFACLLFSRCTEKNPVQPAPKNPQIALIQAPERVYQFPAAPAGIHVRAEDPQGVRTLAGVQLTVRRTNLTQLATLAMLDNGLNGDILAGDGQYFWPIDTALVHGQTGDFIIEAVAKDQSGLTSETARDTIKVLPGRENLEPKLLSFTAPAIIAGDSIYTPVFRATANDADGLASLRFVRVEFFPPTVAKPTLTDSLFDDGKNNDGAANDGIFARAISTSKLCGAGLFSIVFRAVDAASGESPALIGNTSVTRSGINFPPAVSNPNAPATISRNRVPNTYLLSVQASDPNCITDLKRVFFNTFLPNGNPSSGNPFSMRDDGQQGDAVAGDGRYSLGIQITPQNALGNYRFEFQAEDQKGAPSAKLVHTISVTD